VRIRGGLASLAYLASAVAEGLVGVSSSRTRQGGGLDTRSSQQGGLALFGRRESAPVGLPVEFPRQDLCSGPGRAATDPCLSLPSSPAP